jgi:hypothetical protein
VGKYKAELPDGLQPRSVLKYYCAKVSGGLRDVKLGGATARILDWVNEDVLRRYMELVRRILAAALQKIDHIESSPHSLVDSTR